MVQISLLATNAIMSALPRTGMEGMTGSSVAVGMTSVGACRVGVTGWVGTLVGTVVAVETGRDVDVLTITGVSVAFGLLIPLNTKKPPAPRSASARTGKMTT